MKLIIYCSVAGAVLVLGGLLYTLLNDDGPFDDIEFEEKLRNEGDDE